MSAPPDQPPATDTVRAAASTEPFHPAAFSETARAGVYQAIYERRDVRGFRPDPLPDALVARLLDAAHHGPSVGFMQPWGFVVIRDIATRQQVKELFERERQAAACFFDEPRRSQYLGLKLEGILDAPLNVCVTCDPTVAGPTVLGRNSIPETDLYSTCCAVENLWLAARAEGVGVGWVSILKLPQLRALLGIPPHVVPVAYLCVGYPADGFPARPLLETAAWRPRTPLGQVLHYERWSSRDHADWPSLDRLVACALPLLIPEEQQLRETLTRIVPLDRVAMEAARARQDTLTKPQGSLGRLEALHVQLAGITGNPLPTVERKVVIVMAGDHGVVAAEADRGSPAASHDPIAAATCATSVVNLLAGLAGARVLVVDVGLARDVPAEWGVVARRVAAGTADVTRGPAMSRADCLRAIAVGGDIVAEEVARGIDLIATGSLGHGGSVAAAAVIAALTGKRAVDVAGRSTASSDGVPYRLGAIERALRMNRPAASDPIGILASVGGFELAALVGVLIGAAASRLPVVLDGVVTAAAALLAADLCPTLRGYLVAAHSSDDPGVRLVLERLELAPLLALDACSAAGADALLALSLLEAACRIPREMATFGEAGVANREPAG